MASKMTNPSQDVGSSVDPTPDPDTKPDLETEDNGATAAVNSNPDKLEDDIGEDEWETENEDSDFEIGNDSSFEFPFSSEDESDEENDDDKESDEDFEEDNHDPPRDTSWVKDKNFDFEANIPAFKGEAEAGIKVDLGDCPQPIDYFKLFITDDLVKSWAVATNQYVERLSNMGEKGEKLTRNWEPVNFDELMCFLAVCHLMIVSRRPTVDVYWMLNGMMGCNFVQEIIPHKRFRQILKFLQVGPTTDTRQQFSTRWLIKHLNTVSKEICTPGRHLYVKEEKCPPEDSLPRHRLIGEDMPKPGYRFYQVCEGSSGYAYNFELYKNSRKTPGCGEDMVLRLMRPLLNRGHCVHVGFHFCTPRLCQVLLDNGTMTCGTALKNCKGMPKDLFALPQQKGDLDFRRQGQLVACRWKGKRGAVNTLSTFHKPEMKLHKKEFAPLSFISCVTNTFPREDFETLTELFPDFRSALGKREPFFYILVFVALQVTALIRKRRAAKGMKAQDVSSVISRIIEGITGSVAWTEDPNHKLRRLSQLSGGMRHRLINYPQLDGEKNESQCQVCARRAGRCAAGKTPKEGKASIRQTEHYCADCSVSLCQSPCFEDYHTKDDYGAC